MKALEDFGAIIGYKAQLNPSSIGLDFAALVFVTLKEGDRAAVAKFEDEVKELPHVILAQRLFGEPDFLMHMVAKDLAAFQAYYDSTLSALLMSKS
ncbi:TPA: Lrp/AsnC family transcriptional regulator [Vibrio cholerae]